MLSVVSELKAHIDPSTLMDITLLETSPEHAYSLWRVDKSGVYTTIRLPNISEMNILACQRLASYSENLVAEEDSGVAWSTHLGHPKTFRISVSYHQSGP